MAMRIPSGLETPLLLLDEARMQHNIERMQSRMDALGVRFRPHVKTSKCPEVVRRQLAAGALGITVSTLKEAERFAAEGVTDILYAVAIVPGKFDHALRLARDGARLTLVVESVDAARELARHGAAHGHCHEVLIEVDTDGHRSGVRPDDRLLFRIADALRDDGGRGSHLAGVMTHAGSSYALSTPDALAAMAEKERAGCVAAAERLRAAGHACETVSVGSTPTALSARSLEGVTEVRAGVYVFFDLVMAGIGVCTRDDIALSVLCTVIGHRPDAGWIITDAGWMAVSRDRGTRTQAHDFGYGAVCDAEGRAIDELAFADANQEHGVLHWFGDPRIDLPRRFPLGSQLRIVPNHACATGAQHDGYTVLRAAGGDVERWPRFNGW
jgi:D-serine deaminase-like pyridoxal phosphate-dependent protein